MKLLIITQKVDIDDPILGFFHEWVKGLARNFEKVNVICLEKGKYEFPSHVSVFSLGKEKSANRVKYLTKLYRYIWKLRGDYDVVFVHMNQEYVILVGIVWKLLGKKIFLWRNHAKGNLLTRVSVFLSDVIFCTSLDAFVAKYRKTKIMPVGVDTDIFKISGNSIEENTFIMIGRIDPVKRVECLIKAIGTLRRDGIILHAHIVGNHGSKNTKYFNFLNDLILANNLNKQIQILPSVTHSMVPGLLSRYKFFVNLTAAGSLDKTIFEALASGLITVVANPFFNGKLPDQLVVKNVDDTAELAKSIKYAIEIARKSPDDINKKINEIINEHNLNHLITELTSTMTS